MFGRAAPIIRRSHRRAVDQAEQRRPATDPDTVVHVTQAAPNGPDTEPSTGRPVHRERRAL
jgi:hypothetical protein